MAFMEPTEEQINEVMAGPEGPVVMVNLLRYKRDETGNMTGFESYQKYSEAVTPILIGVGGEFVSVGRVDSVVIGDHHWDTVLLIKYPSRQAFLGMITSQEYLAIHHLRAEALEDSGLIATTPDTFI
jgi:uncharacterized protein (DUF1330 family)